MDSPRFDWRGALLDVGRHYFSVPFIYKFLDVCAFYKINKFHWHLTEDQVCMPATQSPVRGHHPDLLACCRCNSPRAPGADARLQCEEGAPVQGWRIEIKAFPKLTEFGSWRGRDPDSMYGGFYTQEQVRGWPHLSTQQLSLGQLSRHRPTCLLCAEQPNRRQNEQHFPSEGTEVSAVT